MDAEQVAALIGLSGHRSISTYRARFDDFPMPIIERGSGRCLLWLRQDIERWMKQHPRRQRPHRDEDTDPS
jgi:predicted DNA-binding transcriptional regulator AlpA